MADTLALDTRRTALLIMDFQAGIVSGVTDEYPHLLDNTASVLAAARDAGLLVIYIVVGFHEGYPEVSPRNKTFADIRASGRLLVGDPEVAVHERVAPRPGDLTLTKHRVGAFSTTPLDTILRAQGVATLILCGIATSGVTLSTVRAAADLDYRLVVVEDCCADRDAEVHRILMQKVFPRQASVVTSHEVIAALTTR